MNPADFERRIAIKPDQEEQWIEANGLRFHVILAGPENGKPVMLLHGFPDFWYGWEKQIGPLAEAGLRVIVPDQRGYNLSDKPKGAAAYRLDLLAQDVVGLLDRLGFQKINLVGHDWGGLVAWTTAVLYPERVERLAVLDAPYPTIVSQTVFSHPEQLLKSAYVYFFQLPWLPEIGMGRDHWNPLVKSLRKTMPPGLFSDAMFDRYREAWDQENAMTSMLNWYRALVRHPAKLPAKPRLRMPTLILWGGQDFALGRELAEASLTLCEKGELIIFDHANHWIQHEEAQEVNRLLLMFLHGIQG